MTKAIRVLLRMAARAGLRPGVLNQGWQFCYSWRYMRAKAHLEIAEATQRA